MPTGLYRPAYLRTAGGIIAFHARWFYPSAAMLATILQFACGDLLALLNVDERGRLDFGCEQRLDVPRCYLIHEHLAIKNAARIERAGGNEFDYERSGPISPHSTRPPEPPFSGTSV